MNEQNHSRHLRQYTDEDRANALAALQANGGDITRTARSLGIPRRTLRNWANGISVSEETAQAAEAKRKPLAKHLRELAAVRWGESILPQESAG